MNIKPIVEKVSKNWPVKVICFVLAVAIYFFYQVSLLESKSFVLPLEIKASGTVVPVSGLEKHKSVKVTVRTKSNRIDSISESDFKAYIDLTPYTKNGSIKIPVIIEPSDKALLLEPLEITVYPSNLKLKIENKKTKTVRIQPSVIGIPAYGFRYTSISCEPNAVTISGPASFVDKIDFMPLPSLNIDGCAETVTKVNKVINTNSYISVLDDNLVRVSAVVVPQEMVREVKNIPVEFDGLKENLVIEEKNISCDSVLEGNVLDLDSIKDGNVKAVADCSFIEMPGEYELSVLINAPKKVSVSSQSVSKIKVHVLERPVEPAVEELVE